MARIREAGLTTLKQSKLLRALAAPHRLQIITLLFSRSQSTVVGIIEALDLEQSTVSEHLAVLRKLGIVTRRKVGTRMIYSLVAKPGLVDGCLSIEIEPNTVQDGVMMQLRLIL